MARSQADFTSDRFQAFVTSLNGTPLARTFYCYQLGMTFGRVSVLENTIIDAMAMCDRIKVQSVLGEDAKKWQDFVAKRNELQSSTLGSLIAILARHNIHSNDLAYLRWLKQRRDFFVHRFFRDGSWPGELGDEACEVMVRRLRYLELIFHRGANRIFKILARANLVLLHDLGADGQLVMSLDMFNDKTHGADGETK